MPVMTARKKSAWREIQSRTKIKKRNKLTLGVLALIAGLLIISWTIRFTQSLFSPWKLSGNQQKSYFPEENSRFAKQKVYIWNGQFNINLLVRNPHISLLSYNPKEEKIIILNIPDELFLDVPFGFGKWQLRAVYELGQTQKGMGGDRLLKDTLTSFFAVPIDGFLDFSSLQPSKSTSEIVEILRSNPFSGLNLLSFLKTDLTVWELLRLRLSLSSVRFDKVKELDLLGLGILERENLSDGTQVLITDSIKLDSVLSGLADPAIVSEHKTIAVFNATDKVQLAGKWARLITNLGGNVIIINNAKERLKKTAVWGEESLTLKRIRQIFCDTINSPEDVTSSRAQINLFIGEDYLNK